MKGLNPSSNFFFFLSVQDPFPSVSFFLFVIKVMMMLVVTVVVVGVRTTTSRTGMMVMVSRTQMFQKLSVATKINTFHLLLVFLSVSLSLAILFSTFFFPYPCS